ncbi:MAG TPA: 4Fe-4S binding protein [Limnochordales bacterium]
MGGVREMVDTALSIGRGMAVTISNFFQPAITQQYPEERRATQRGDRGLPVLLSMPGTEILKCTACELCARACPVECITIGWDKVDRKTARPEDVGNDTRTGRALRLYNLDASLCLYCGLCAEACPYEALAMSDVFELAEATPGQAVPVALDTERYDGGFPGRTAGDARFVYGKERLAALGRSPGGIVSGRRFEPYVSLQRDGVWEERDEPHNIFPPRPDARHEADTRRPPSATRASAGNAEASAGHVAESE